MKEQFSSRWGLILASLGMAIGAGNLWRFPRLAGQYGGTFLVLWIIFLFIWSIPILLAEFSMGKEVKKGVIGSFGTITGKSYTWMGFFIALCTLGIAFYYSVVTAWGIRYLGFSLFNGYQELVGGLTLQQKIIADPQHLTHFWDSLSSHNLFTVGLHIVAVVIGCLLLYRGVQQGLERANRILIPTLFVLMVLISIISLNMENGILGLEYMFSIKPELFRDPNVWIEALSQSAWSTGAGWGLIMTLSAYSKKNEDVSLNIFISGFGNNTASLLAGFAILPAVFALAGSEADAVSYLQSGNQALTFSIIPSLFSGISGGIFLSIVFFVAFCLAAFSSFLAMLELFILMLSDLKIPRKKAVLWVGGICILMGLPSAWSLDFFNNQDWVWGIGLIISGMFIIFSVLKHGAKRFKERYIDKDSDFKVNTPYFVFTLSLNLLFACVLIYWWMSRGYDANPWWDEAGNWNVLSVYSNASIVTQWGAVILIGILLNGFLYRKFVANTPQTS